MFAYMIIGENVPGYLHIGMMERFKFVARYQLPFHNTVESLNISIIFRCGNMSKFMYYINLFQICSYRFSYKPAPIIVSQGNWNIGLFRQYIFKQPQYIILANALFEDIAYNFAVYTSIKESRYANFPPIGCT